MRYIQKLRLENFQSHKDTELNFEPGINIIVGSSDSGKSAILRSINFLFQNPRNANYLRNGTKEARVTVWFSDGTVVSRIKGTQRNAVMAELPDGNKFVFEKIGQDPEYPREILNALGNPPIDKINGPIYYSRQMGKHSYFLTDLSSTELPRSISELIGIEDFELAASELGKRSHQASKQVKDSEERIFNCENDLRKYVKLEDQLKQITKFQEKSLNVENKISEANNVLNLLSRYEVLRIQGKQAKQKLKNAQAIAKFDIHLPNLQTIKTNISVIDQLLKQYADILVTEKKAQNSIIRSKKIHNKSILDNIKSANELITKVNAITTLLDSYIELKKKGSSAKLKFNEWTEKYNNLIVEKESIMVEMKAQGLWCDKCNRPLAVDPCRVKNNG